MKVKYNEIGKYKDFLFRICTRKGSLRKYTITLDKGLRVYTFERRKFMRREVD